MEGTPYSEGSRPPVATPTVIYVMGAGRSGSTILGVALGNCERVFFAGELDKWLLRRGRPRRQDPRRTRFWEAVLAQVTGAEPLFGSAVHNDLERSSSLFRPARRSVGRRLRVRYRQVTEDLYRATASAAEATHVVDTSHYPLRARELQRLPGIDLFLVLLVRDPRAVMASMAREDVPEPTFRTLNAVGYLTLTYLISAWVYLRQPRSRRMVVRHERFLGDPERVIGELLARAGAHGEPPDFSALETGMPLQGNRLIDADTVALRRG
ncbi:MAG TPA: sulfotransferase [Solirubrobacteraceae bacterium]|nr:sulfotransferase [Solirubrobacteraceae bacterium]